MFDHSRQALMFENQLNQFAVENKLSVSAWQPAKSFDPIWNRESAQPSSLTSTSFSSAFRTINFRRCSSSCRAGSDGRTLFERRPVASMMRMYEFIEMRACSSWICSASEVRDSPRRKQRLIPNPGRSAQRLEQLKRASDLDPHNPRTGKSRTWARLTIDPAQGAFEAIGWRRHPPFFV